MDGEGLPRISECVLRVRFEMGLGAANVGECRMPKDRSKTYADRQSEASRGRKQKQQKQEMKKAPAKKKATRD
jgi:hypothetical protein